MASPTTVSPTISPVAPPTPTPTSSEDAVTKPPIAINDIDGNENDDLVFPTVCDEDIVVLKQVGTTHILLHKNEGHLYYYSRSFHRHGTTPTHLELTKSTLIIEE